ncbi:Formamidopyrimidine-DNA glycosylase [Melia azedarach]|uniref:Formamidopyrimidine-DNA glycosylase n=1 Tax=Melia azedarach TaxID=155640 RepID=A0ACC1Y4A1_MELAZ|nr:Formamidopyrimidine-DNA glycosylase [Melia azedarach]
MPELPEVEAARRAIKEHCIGKKIVKSIIADDKKVIDGVSASDFEASILGKTILSAHRKGKNMWLRLDSPPFPSFQFGMSGAIYIKGVAVTKYKRSAVKDADEWPSKYSKFFVELDDGLELSFTDKRRFAKVRLLENPTSVPPISELGPDALLEPMTADEYAESLSKRKLGIKALLLDQSFISGIGNWLADEVLYQARIHPQQIAASLSKESCATLLKCIKEVIEKAIEVGADSSQFPDNWIFHSREKKPGKAFVDVAPSCMCANSIFSFLEFSVTLMLEETYCLDSSARKKIDFITAGGRTTAYVPELQKLNGVQTAKAVSKPKKQASKRKNTGDDDEDNSVDEPESDGEEITEHVKSKKGGKPRAQAKKPSKKRKSKESDDDDEDDSGGDDDESGDDDADEVPKTKSGKVTKSKPAKAVKTPKEKVVSQKSKPMKKKAK